MRHPVQESPLEETSNTGMESGPIGVGTETEPLPGTCLMCFKPFEVESTYSNLRQIYQVFENSGRTNYLSGPPENENNSNWELGDECLPLCPECFEGAAMLAEVAEDIGPLGYRRYLKIVTVRESEDLPGGHNPPGPNPAAEIMKIPNQNSEETQSIKGHQSTMQLTRRRRKRSSRGLKKDSLIIMDIEPTPSTSRALAPRFILENKENDSAATNLPAEKGSPPAEIALVSSPPSTNLPNAEETIRVEDNPAEGFIEDEHLADIETLMEIENINLENFATTEHIAAVENFCDLLAGTCLEEIPAGAGVNHDIGENLAEIRNLLGVGNHVDAEKFAAAENPTAIVDIVADENLSNAKQAQDEENPIAVKNLRDAEKDLPGSEANATEKLDESSPERENDSAANVKDTISLSAESHATLTLTPLRILGNGSKIVVRGDVKGTKLNNNSNRKSTRTIWARRNGSSSYTRKNQRPVREFNRRVLNRKNTNAEIQKTALKAQAGTKSKPKCPRCGKQFLNAINVATHTRRFHKISRDNKMQLSSIIQKHTFQCPKCGKQFVDQLKVTSHIRAVHQKPRSGEGKETSQKIKVTIQRKEKPKPQCGICRRKFLNKWRVRRHIQVVHLVFHERDRKFANSTPFPKKERLISYSQRQLR